jgi:diguanylate cyclase (GGDEF)-like protein
MLPDLRSHQRVGLLRRFAVGFWLVGGVWSSPAAAQQTAIHFERVPGLSQSSVNCSFQDHRGFMWFGTEDGLNRFDGYSFTVYRSDPATAGTLSNNFIWAAEEDAEGALWVGTEAGLNRLPPGTTRFTRLRHDASDPNTVGSDFVWALLRDRQGAVWVGTKGGGLSRYDPKARLFKRYRHDPNRPYSLPSDDVRALAESRSGAIWVATLGGGLARLDPATGRFAVFRHSPSDPASLPDDEVRTVFEDTDGRVWVGTMKGGAARLAPDKAGFIRYVHDPRRRDSLGKGMVRAIGQDALGAIWIGTDDGLNLWRQESESFLHFNHDSSRPFSLSDDTITSIFSDRGGVLWIGTKTAGLNRWNPAAGAFTSYTADAAAGSLSHRVITSFAEGTDGALWVGTFGGGLNRLDRAAALNTPFRADGRPGSIGDDRVMSLLLDRRGTLWAGTFAAGLYRMPTGSSRFERMRPDPARPASLSDKGVTCLLEARDGTIWFGTYGGGLHRFEPVKGLQRFTHDPAVGDSLASDVVTALAEDQDGTLWVGTRGGGLDAFDPRSGRARHLRRDEARRDGLSSDELFALHLDTAGTLWIGTLGAGLDRWDAAARRAGRVAIRHYTERDGLPNNVVYAVLSDENGFVWASTNRGLVRLEPKNGATRVYDTTYGLPGDEFNYGAALRSRRGEMFFGGTNGFVSFFPGVLRSNEHAPPVVLTGISALNHPLLLTRPVSDLDAVDIGWRDYLFAFDFAALDFTAPEKNRYAYRLEGFDRDWIDAGSIRRATYTNVSPGSYTFRVKAANNDGVWNDSGLALRVRVVAPPWRSAWAYALYALAAAGAVYSWIRVQRRRLAREEEYSRRLELEVRERTAELAQRNQDLHDATRRFEEASLTDSLTGLRNRRYLLSELEGDMALTARQRIADPAHAPSYLFLMIDLDGFKQLNDRHGHRAGDDALRHVTAVLREACRRSDVIVRFGGDEFLVIGRQLERSGGDVLAERIRAAVAECPVTIAGGTAVRLSCSIGYALHPFTLDGRAGLGWEQVLAIADRALYAAKASGRNAWVGFEEGSTRFSGDLQEALSCDPAGAVAAGYVALRASVPAERITWRIDR